MTNEPESPADRSPGSPSVAGTAPESDEAWRAILMGTDRDLPRLRRMWSLVPSEPRCKLCAAPFGGAGRIVTKIVMHGPSNANPLLCNACFGQIRKHPGGAEVPIGVLFADIRGSTSLAERTSAASFRRLVEQFYRRAAKAVDEHEGIVDKFLGDGVMALFIPVVTGELHARRAIEAGEALLRAVEASELAAGGVRVGVGVHSGEAFVGAIGSDDRLDFTALGDTVNVAARLGALAGAGELLVSKAAWLAAGRPDSRPRRSVTLTGRAGPLDVVVLGGTAVALA